jgi:hypothetical protein
VSWTIFSITGRRPLRAYWLPSRIAGVNTLFTRLLLLIEPDLLETSRVFVLISHSSFMTPVRYRD